MPLIPPNSAGGAPYDSFGIPEVTLYANGGAIPANTISSDGITTAQQALLVLSAQFVYNGVSLDKLRTPTVFKVVTAQALVAGTGATVWTPVGGKKIRVMGYSFSSTVACGLILGDNVAATVVYRGPLLAAAGIDSPVGFGNGILLSAANNVLKVDCTVATVITGSVWGTEE